MDFLENNRQQLVQTMGMATVNNIVHCLFAKSVLSNEEKDSIICQKTRQDASRELIYSVLNKGNKACEYLVRSLEETDFFLFQKLQGTYISGQMTQQDVDCLAADLISLYKHASFERFHPLGEEIDIIFSLKNTYTDILLWKKDIHNTRLAQVPLNGLLDVLENPCVIEGEAGKGKTTLLKKIALLWANEDHPSLMKFKLVFFISLSGAEEGLYETICEQLLKKKYRICKEDFMEMLELLGEKVLFLLDGYDEFKSQSCQEIESLIKENHPFRNTVIVTTRTESIRRLRLFGSLIAETGDLTVESAKMLVKNILKDDTFAKGLLSQLQNSDSQLENLMKTPLFVIIACAIQMGESTFTPHTQTTLFSTLYDLLVGKNKYKIRETTDKHFRLSIIHCGDLALDGVFEQKFVFHPEDFSSVKERVLLAIGLMHKYTAQRLKEAYTFFHKSFQEYIAGRRLSRLLESHRNEEVTKGLSYLQKINSFLDIFTTYHSLLLYTCGSSSKATRKIMQHLSAIHQQGSLFRLPFAQDLFPEEIKTYKEIAQDEYGFIATRENSFVECAIRFLYESISETTIKEDFEEFFCNKALYINTQSIPAYVCGFFDYFSNCVSMLKIIKLDFSGNLSAEKDGKKESFTATAWKTVIPEKAVSLFFNWDRKLNDLEITLKDFNKLEKGDVKYLEKICCSASGLKLHISQSPGLTGKLREVLSSCTNLQHLIVESTPLSLEDEQQITKMMVLKTIKIKNLQSINESGGLLDGISTLANVEKIMVDDIKMNENSIQKLAEGLKNLKKLNILHLKNLMNVGDGMTDIIKSVSLYLQDLEEIHLVNCCISGFAVEILVQNICSFPKLYALDLSNNFLGNNGKEALCKLVDSLHVLPQMKVLMFPYVTEVNDCLVKLEELEKMPQLTKLGLKKWGFTDSDARILGTLFENASLRDLRHLDMAENCLTSEGWLTILKALTYLEKLTFLDFSRPQGFIPSALLVLAVARLISQLVSLQQIDLTGWQFDTYELQEINRVKESHRKGLKIHYNLLIPSPPPDQLNNPNYPDQ